MPSSSEDDHTSSSKDKMCCLTMAAQVSGDKLQTARMAPAGREQDLMSTAARLGRKWLQVHCVLPLQFPIPIFHSLSLQVILHLQCSTPFCSFTTDSIHLNFKRRTRLNFAKTP